MCMCSAHTQHRNGRSSHGRLPAQSSSRGRKRGREAPDPQERMRTLALALGLWAADKQAGRQAGHATGPIIKPDIEGYIRHGMAWEVRRRGAEGGELGCMSRA